MIIPDLVARLEAAREPSRELDCLIARSVGAQWQSHHNASHYTASIEAALTLAPDGANCHGYDLSPTGVEAYFSRNNVSTGRWMELSSHPTSPAIAFCIAALKRRLATDRSGARP